MVFIKPPCCLFGEAQVIYDEAYNETSEQCTENGGDQSIRMHLEVVKGGFETL